jgi:hypothetical protein
MLRGQRRAWCLGTRLYVGGQAVVHEGWSGATWAAVKRPSRPEGAAALRREAQAMRELAAAAPDASWLVPVLDEGEDETGQPFYVMPWYEHTLKDLLNAPLLDRLDVLVQAAAAVRRLHAIQRGVIVAIHQDIKPANLLIEPAVGRWRLRVADFGILRQQALFTEQTNAVMFSWQYAPPEQLLPLLGEPDPSVDVFALAAVAFHTLTGDGPPEVSAQAANAFTSAGAELRALTVGGGGGERLDALRRRPVTELIDADLGALSEPERATLRNRLEDALLACRAADGAPLGAQASGALVYELAELLLPVLEHALRPCPRLRQGDATRLRDALRQAYDLVAGELGRPMWTPLPAPTGSAGDAPGLRPGGPAPGDLPVPADATSVPPTGPAGSAASAPETPTARRVIFAAIGAAVALLAGWGWLETIPAPAPPLEQPAVVTEPEPVGTPAPRPELPAPAVASRQSTPRSPEQPPVAAPPAPARGEPARRPEPAVEAPTAKPAATPSATAAPSCVRLTALADGGMPSLGNQRRPRDLQACDGDVLTVSFIIESVAREDRRTLRLEVKNGQRVWRLGEDRGPVRGDVLSLRWSRGRWRASGG